MFNSEIDWDLVDQDGEIYDEEFELEMLMAEAEFNEAEHERREECGAEQDARLILMLGI